MLLHGEANVLALTGVRCDHARLVVEPRPGAGSAVTFHTDFRYIPMAHRVAPGLKVRDFRDFRKGKWRRIGYEGSIPAASYLELRRQFPRAALVDVEEDVHRLRAVKSAAELAGLVRAEALNDEIWCATRREIRPGMTEKDIQRLIRARMNALGDGEAFETIVCAGKNAAECHHVPDDTVWHRGEPLLVDMGVKLDGFCSDMTRCLPDSKGLARARGLEEYRKIYGIVLEANRKAIAAARPGMTGRELDKVARDVIRRAGYGKCFGHALGHGVGYEIHEAPAASSRSEMKLEPGMLVTIEPGIYLEGKLGVRIEDLVVITSTGCEVLSHSAK